MFPAVSSTQASPYDLDEFLGENTTRSSDSMRRRRHSEVASLPSGSHSSFRSLSIGKHSPETGQHKGSLSPSTAVPSGKFYMAAGVSPQVHDQFTLKPNKEREQSQWRSPGFSNPQFARMTARKRPADQANLDEEDQDPSAAASNPASPSQAENILPPQLAQLCLCPPDPKIPRPRNAFILYRQNHHADILANNPGIANPEVSKIAGHLWSNEVDSVKDQWKRLAEEEKSRHAQQYPQYRFQPKHKAKRGPDGQLPSASVSEKAWCPKCGGRTIAFGTLPTSLEGAPYSPSLGSAGLTLTPVSQTIPCINSLSLQSPHTTNPDNRPFSPAETPTSASMDSSKKRRLETNQAPALARQGEDPHTRELVRQSIPYHGPAYPAQSPGSAGLDYRRDVMGHPPSAQAAVHGRFGYARMNPPRPGEHRVVVPVHNLPSIGQSPRRVSVTAPSPSQMPPPALPPAPVMSQAAPSERGMPNLQGARRRHSANISAAAAASSGQSVEDIIMDWPFPGKVKILRQVTQKIKAPAGVQGAAQAHQASGNGKRGAFIAIEGDENAPIEQVMNGLKDALDKTGEFNVCVMSGPKGLENGLGGLAEGEHDKKATYPELLQEVAKWHDKSKLICEFVTGGISSIDESSSASKEAEPARDSSSMDIDTERPSPRKSRIPSAALAESRNLRRDLQKPAVSQESANADAKATNSNASTTQASGRLPVLIIPGYLMHASNIWAVQLPLVDTYSVLDHWSWVATTWRTVPGPDFTVYIENTEDQKRFSIAAPSKDPRRSIGEQTPTPAGPNRGDSWQPKPMVEIDESLQTVIVRRGKGAELDGAVVRRLAFEVSEWIRNAESR